MVSTEVGAKPGNEQVLFMSLLPTTKIHGKVNLDTKELAKMMGKLPIFYEYGTTFSAIERVNSRPQQSISAMFRFGEAYGIMQGMLAMLPGNRHTYYLNPAVWMRTFNIIKADKYGAMRVFCEIFSNNIKAMLWLKEYKLKKHNHLYEATLIGIYALRHANSSIYNKPVNKRK